MSGLVSLINGHVDPIMKCEECGSNHGYEREDGVCLCDKCYSKPMLSITNLGEVSYGKHFDAQVDKLVEKFDVSYNHAGCYLVNFEDEYYCHQMNGGCPDIEKCRKIREEWEQE